MDGCRWGFRQLINASIISSEDLPLLRPGRGWGRGVGVVDRVSCVWPNE